MDILLICLKIFFARILDVSLGTVRTMLIVKERRLVAAFIGFVEALIWFLIVKEALTLATSGIYVAASYAGGFAVGTYVGTSLAKKYIIGKVMVQVFTHNLEDVLIDEIRKHGFGVTVLEYKGISGTKDGRMLNISINKSKEKNLRNLIKEYDSSAFIVVNESKYVENGYFK
ncbi:MAG: DUF5698 domain-containing protein [Bacilli bacterium]|jgi:uncharacterized protein YebE (UPF0316 family)|nr:DUF5698 domain-containing protein [Bacilli bacterium]